MRPLPRTGCPDLDAKTQDLKGLENMIVRVIEETKAKQSALNARQLPDEAEHPASSPIYWVSKWVDYSDKYGIGKIIIFSVSTRHFAGMTFLVKSSNN